jgi:hypothetical protein
MYSGGIIHSHVEAAPAYVWTISRPEQRRDDDFITVIKGY